MGRLASFAISLGAALILPAAAAAQSEGAYGPFDIPPNPLIAINYVPPQSERYQAIYERLRQFQALERLQRFLAPLQLPSELAVSTDECDGALEKPYDAGHVTICYEYVDLIEYYMPSDDIVLADLRPEEVIIGPFVQHTLHDVALAIFDMLEIPVWGRAEDAADRVAAYISLQFGDDMARMNIIGTAWFLSQRGFMGVGSFTEVANVSEAQRFYNYLCVAYGYDAEKFGALVRDALPKERTEGCEDEFDKLRRSFDDTIMAHVDRELLDKVRNTDWLQ